MTTITQLQQRVIDRVAECFAIVQASYPDMEFTLPTVGFGVNTKTAGIAYPKMNKVSFNNTLLNENAEHFIKNTVAHEVAHIIDGILYDTFQSRFDRVTGKRIAVQAHGKTWKHIMGIIGVDADRVHQYDVSNVGRKTRPHNYECTKCKHVIPLPTRTHNKILKNGVKYVHSGCQADLAYIGTPK